MLPSLPTLKCSSNKIGNNETIKIQLNEGTSAMGLFPLGRCYRWLLLPIAAVSVAFCAFCYCAMVDGAELCVLLPYIHSFCVCVCVCWIAQNGECC